MFSHFWAYGYMANFNMHVKGTKKAFVKPLLYKVVISK